MLNLQKFYVMCKLRTPLNDYDYFFDQMSAENFLSINSTFFHTPVCPVTFKNYTSLFLAIGLLGWCLFLAWGNCRETSEFSLVIPRVIVALSLFFWYIDFRLSTHLQGFFDRFSVFAGSNYGVACKAILLVFVVIVVFSRLLTVQQCKYTLLLLLFAFFLFDASHLLSLYVCF